VLGSPNRRASEWHRPLIYFARAVDGIELDVTLSLAGIVARELDQFELQMIDPIAVENESGRSRRTTGGRRHVVEFDLAILRKCDGVLMDMSIPSRNYIGCSCELTYAYIWRIPSVVYLGTADLDRPWLRYHARAVHRERSDAIRALAELLK
jgi:hypothetical protein